ncbi:hypothetical protein [Tateyamaria sp.]|uniref:hypothetical protein n=1 Tax=Tateyamaria sp. TaxID=1929288 RepID=UPI003B21E2C2
MPRFVALVPTVTAGADPPTDIQTNSTTRAGQFIGFYAAAPGALAYETTPAGADTAHGLMTWSLAHALRTGRAQTYADLAQLMTAQLWQTGGGLSEPAFDGAVGAPHVFAGTAQTNRTFGLEVAEGITLKAGYVDGLRPGAVIQIEDQAGNPLFNVTVTQVSLTQAQAPLPTGEAPALDALLRAEQLDPARFRSRWLADRAPTLVGRVVSMPLDTTLSVGLNLGAEDDGLRPAIKAMIKTLAPAVRHDDDTPDVQIASTGGTLGLRPVDPGAAQVLDLPARPDAIPALADTLRRMIKTRALLAAAVTLNDSALAQALDVDLSVQPGTDDGTGGCKPVGPAKRIDIAALHPPTIEHCDTVALTLRNDNPWPIDVSVFYLASDFQVYFLTGFGGSEKGGWRIPAGAPARSAIPKQRAHPTAKPWPPGRCIWRFLRSGASRGKHLLTCVTFNSCDPRPRHVAHPSKLCHPYWRRPDLVWPTAGRLTRLSGNKAAGGPCRC